MQSVKLYCITPPFSPPLVLSNCSLVCHKLCSPQALLVPGSVILTFYSFLPSFPGTGHHYGGLSLLPGSLLLDLAPLDTVHVDPAARTAAVGPGATGRALAEALAGHGLHFPLPHISAVGLGGFLLGGWSGVRGQVIGAGPMGVRSRPSQIGVWGWAASWRQGARLGGLMRGGVSMGFMLIKRG